MLSRLLQPCNKQGVNKVEISRCFKSYSYTSVVCEVLIFANFVRRQEIENFKQIFVCSCMQFANLMLQILLLTYYTSYTAESQGCMYLAKGNASILQPCHKLTATMQGCNNHAARLLQPTNFHMECFTVPCE